MPFSYNPIAKAEMIQLLVENFGDVHRTARDANFPERTLYEWKQELTVNTVLLPRDPDDVRETITRAQYEKIRNDLISHIHTLTEQIGEKPEKAADLVIALTRLIDRLEKLERILDPRHFTLIILYEHPDGTIREEPSREIFKKP